MTDTDDTPRPVRRDETPLLPTQTRDDLDEEWEPRRGRVDADVQRLLDERPPHWG